MAGEGRGPEDGPIESNGHALLLQVEGALRECLNTLDELGLSRTAAHLDLALHQLYKDMAELRRPPRNP